MNGDAADFPCDDWARLASEDPASFETARRLTIDSLILIEAAPTPLQARLRSLQWQIDQVRAMTRTPLGTCAKISNLMWEKLLGPEGLVEQLERLDSGESSPDKTAASAQVIPLRRLE
jgi:hypothetical protein